MNPNCIERRNSTVAPQALHLMNSGMVQQLAEHFAERVHREAGTDPADQVAKVYWIALSRPPTDEEKEVGVDALARLSATWAKYNATVPRLSQPGHAGRDAADRKALVTFCHAIMNSAAFLYVD